MYTKTNIGTVLDGDIRDTTTGIDELIARLQEAKANGHTTVTPLYVTDALESEGSFGWDGGSLVYVFDYDSDAHEAIESKSAGTE